MCVCVEWLFQFWQDYAETHWRIWMKFCDDQNCLDVKPSEHVCTTVFIFIMSMLLYDSQTNIVTDISTTCIISEVWRTSSQFDERMFLTNGPPQELQHIMHKTTGPGHRQIAMTSTYYILHIHSVSLIAKQF